MYVFVHSGRRGDATKCSFTSGTSPRDRRRLIFLSDYPKRLEGLVSMEHRGHQDRINGGTVLNLHAHVTYSTQNLFALQELGQEEPSPRKQRYR